MGRIDGYRIPLSGRIVERMAAAENFSATRPAGVAQPDGNAHALKALLAAQHGAAKARTAAVNQIKALLASAPSELGDRYRRPTRVELVRALLRCRPSAYGDPTTVAVLTACKALAQRVQFLDRQELNLAAEFRALLVGAASDRLTHVPPPIWPTGGQTPHTF